MSDGGRTGVTSARARSPKESADGKGIYFKVPTTMRRGVALAATAITSATSSSGKIVRTSADHPVGCWLVDLAGGVVKGCLR